MARRIIEFLIISLTFGLIISSCYYDNEDELYPVEEACDTASLSYEGQIGEIINSKCASPACHGGTQNPNLTDFSSVSNRIGRIEERALNQMTMPPSSSTPLTDCEKRKLQVWINNGSPQN